MAWSLRLATFIAGLFASGGSALSVEQAGPPSANATFTVDLPARCQLRETCWVVNYVDVDPGPGARDFRCGPRTYHGHDGIDLAIRDREVMAQGVPVLAVAPGTVRRVRDGVADEGLTNAASREALAGRECGNGIVLDHGNGWETQYCHLQQRSVQVAVGQQIERGAPLGLIGLSGQTEFPHVHLTVRHDGAIIDPFTGRQQGAGCGEETRALWRDPGVTYEDVALYHAGFASAEPHPETIRQGHAIPEKLSTEAPALVLWVDLFGVQAEDRLRFRIMAPDGRLLLDQALGIDRTQARRFVFAGLRRQGRLWPSGLYHGEVELGRGRGATAWTRTRLVTVQMEPR